MSSQAGGRDPRLDKAGPSARGLGPKALVWGAFGVSAALHLFFLVLYPSLFPELGPADGGFFPSGAPVTDGMEVVRVIEIDVAEEVEEPEAPEFEPVEEREIQVATPTVSGTPPVDFSRPGITAAERLRVNLRDPRLWAPLPPEFRELTLEQREELALAGRLREWYDSVQAAAAAEAAFTDWTFTDGDGRRWGFADGRMYLGDYEVPLPQFAPPPGAARETAWRYSELARQGQSAAVQQTVRDRMEAIRARRDAERARERASQRTDSASAR